MRYEYYRDRDVAFEGFTSKSYLFREEFTSRIWATRYDFPAMRDGRVKRDVIRDDTPSGAQGWFFNTRREKFKDKRLEVVPALVRRAGQGDGGADQPNRGRPHHPLWRRRSPRVGYVWRLLGTRRTASHTTT